MREIDCFSECKHGGNPLDFIAELENVSIHAAALKAIEWFQLDSDAMSAKRDENDDEPSEGPKSDAAPAQHRKDAALAQRAYQLDVLGMGPDERHRRARRATAKQLAIGDVVGVPHLLGQEATIAAE